MKLGLRSVVWVTTGDGIRESEVLGLAVSSGTPDRIGNRTGREWHRGQRESARALNPFAELAREIPLRHRKPARPQADAHARA